LTDELIDEKEFQNHVNFYRILLGTAQKMYVGLFVII